MSFVFTFSSATFRSFSCSGGVLRRRTSQASFSRGMTLRKMSVAMKSEQIGSAMSQPNWRMRMVEMMTPTLPSVSARTWRKTPGGRRGKKERLSVRNGQTGVDVSDNELSLLDYWQHTGTAATYIMTFSQRCHATHYNFFFFWWHVEVFTSRSMAVN